MEKANILSKKIVVVGNSGVGKTALTLRFVQNSFDPDSPPTIGGSFLAKKISVGREGGKEDTLSLQIWDTAGQERFRSMVRIYYRGASAAILVFDGTNKESFRSLKDWVVELHSVLGKDIAIAIACNKIDLVENSEPIMEKAEEYARSINAKVYPTSAKTGVGM
uniref:GTP-binding protein n=1 Tax=Palpitomonas bilix TaxID=652834 RepID=A0A7S3D144_9EUKA|mmetsp:Transcript_17868/g.44297  ORF Transcript_17868/g.44297 Transcript_17868/m.44297 type:complete len:164 (+) Transcript_17868:73-564(+)